MGRRRWTLPAIGIVGLVVAVAAGLAVVSTRSGDDDGDATRRSHDAPRPPVLEGRGSGERPPPEVAETAAPEQGSTPEAPVVCTVRVLHPLGTIPPDVQRARRIGGWFLETSTREFKGSGPIAFDGLVGLTAADVEEWRRCTLAISLFGFDDELVERPGDPVPREMTVSVKSSRPLVTYSGQVRDPGGRPLAAAGVFLAGSWWSPLLEPAVRTEADGTFTLTAGVGPAREPPESKPPTLEVVAPGFEPATVAVRRDGESGLHVTLADASTDGSLDLLLVAPDGRPAAGAHALLFPVGLDFVDEGGWPRPLEDLRADPRAESRRRLGRLLGRPSYDSQGSSFSSGVLSVILDLRTDRDGHLRIDALPVGRYRLRAVFPAEEGEDGRGEWIGIRSTRVEATVESTIEVVAPPAVSSATVRFPPGRTVVGRMVVAVNPAWHCGRERHVHVLRAFGWPWLGDELESGAGRSASFRLEGLPYGAFSLHVRTDDRGQEGCVVHTWKDDHGEISVDVPAAPTPTSALGATTDLGDIVVPDVRVVFGKIVSADGARIARPGPVVEMRGVEPAPRMRVNGSAFRITLERPPGAGAVLVVGRDAEHPDVVRVPWPFDLGDAQHPLVITLPQAVRASDR